MLLKKIDVKKCDFSAKTVLRKFAFGLLKTMFYAGITAILGIIGACDSCVEYEYLHSFLLGGLGRCRAGSHTCSRPPSKKECRNW